jgi:hypothetical protein
MAIFALVKNNKIVNVIVADSKEISESVSGYESIETTGQPWIGWERIDGVWVNPSPDIVEEPTE